MTTRVVVLGAGFAGLELTSILSEELGEAIEVVLIDGTEGFVFGFSKLDVMFGRAAATDVVHPYRAIDKPGVRFVAARVESIDPITRVVTTSAGTFESDILVVALGADLDPAATPGLVEHGHEFYTEAGAFAAADLLRDFGGGQVVVGVTSTPFKCPPAPSETALLVHDLLERRGLLDTSSISLVMPFGIPIPPSPAASEALLAAFDDRGIRWVPDVLLAGVDGERGVAALSDGRELAADLVLAVPVHRAPTCVLDSGMTQDGWIAVDPLTLETRYPGVYALGDVTSVGTPKAGVFSEGQAAVAARRIVETLRDGAAASTYDGHGLCYLEFGHDQVAQVDVTFMAGERPRGDLVGPSADLVENKSAFGRTRLVRWFGPGSVSGN